MRAVRALTFDFKDQARIQLYRKLENDLLAQLRPDNKAVSLDSKKKILGMIIGNPAKFNFDFIGVGEVLLVLKSLVKIPELKELAENAREALTDENRVKERELFRRELAGQPEIRDWNPQSDGIFVEVTHVDPDQLMARGEEEITVDFSRPFLTGPRALIAEDLEVILGSRERQLENEIKELDFKLFDDAVPLEELLARLDAIIQDEPSLKTLAEEARAFIQEIIRQKQGVEWPDDNKEES